MPNFSPTPSGTIQRPDISMALTEHEFGKLAKSMIASEVLPIVEVGEASGNYGLLKAVEMAQDHDIKRAAGGAYKNIDYKITQANYETEEYGPTVTLDKRFMASQAYILGGGEDKFRMIAAQMAQEVLLLSYEKRVAAKVFDATVFSSNTTAVSTEWSTASSATPSTDVKAAIVSMRAKFGSIERSDLVAIMSSKVRDNLRVVTDITDKIINVRETSQSDITDGDIAKALGVSRLIVGSAMRPSHAQGASASAFVDVWDDEYCMIAKLGGPLNSTSPGLGRTFHWGKDGSIPLGLVETYFSDAVRSEIVRIRHQTDEIIEIVNAGWLLSNITA